MYKNGQFGELMVAIAIVFGVSLAIGFTLKLAFPENHAFFLFLGVLFLICSIVFGIITNLNITTSIVVGGSASAVCFFLSWAIPNGIFVITTLLNSTP